MMIPTWIRKRIVADPDHPGCWSWRRVGTGGYGTAKGIKAAPAVIAHRAVYMTLVGPIPEGLDLDHICRNRACVNPCHLEPVTRSENLLRSPLVGKHWSKLTHCRNGHPFNRENTYERPGRPGRRQCKVCMREATRRWRTRAGEITTGDAT